MYNYGPLRDAATRGDYTHDTRRSARAPWERLRRDTFLHSRAAAVAVVFYASTREKKKKKIERRSSRKNNTKHKSPALQAALVRSVPVRDLRGAPGTRDGRRARFPPHSRKRLHGSKGASERRDSTWYSFSLSLTRGTCVCRFRVVRAASPPQRWLKHNHARQVFFLFSSVCARILLTRQLRARGHTIYRAPYVKLFT